MASIRMTNCVSDWLAIAKNGHRLTDYAKKRTRYNRNYTWLITGRFWASIHHALFVNRWFGNERIAIAIYFFETDTVVINADTHWGRYRSDRLRLEIAEICEQNNQEYVIVSFAAAELAGIALTSIKRITGESMSRKMKTLPEDTPRYLKTRVRWKSGSLRISDGSKPQLPPVKEGRTRYGPTIYPIAEGWAYNWHDTWLEHVPPAGDGFYYWTRPRGHMQPACVFRANGIRGVHRYISALDHNDRPPRYFLSQIPDKAKAHTVDAALDALAPPAVHLARKQGRKVVRQGDVFAIKTDMLEKDLVKRMATRLGIRAFYKRTWLQFPRCKNVPCAYCRLPNAEIYVNEQNMPPIPGAWLAAVQIPGVGHFPPQHADVMRAHFQDVAGRLNVHGTAHTCTHVIKTTDGLVYGKGMLRHEPRLMSEQRARDHQNMRLDDGKDGWWLLVRNTVPPLN